jgi:hypothetical protein
MQYVEIQFNSCFIALLSQHADGFSHFFQTSLNKLNNDS